MRYNGLRIGVCVKGNNDKHERENRKVDVVGTAPLVGIAKILVPIMQMDRMNELLGAGVTRYT